MPKKPLSEKAVREKLSEFLNWGEAHADWKSALNGIEEGKRGVRPQGLPTLAVGAARTRADRAVGHHRVYEGREAQVAGLAVGLLAEIASTA